MAEEIQAPQAGAGAGAKVQYDGGEFHEQEFQQEGDDGFPLLFAAAVMGEEKAQQHPQDASAGAGAGPGTSGMGTGAEAKAKAQAQYDWGEFHQRDFDEQGEFGFPLLFEAAMDVQSALLAEEQEEKEKERIKLGLPKEESSHEDPDEYSNDEEDLNYLVEDMMDPIMGKDDPDRMKLTSKELDMTLAIREAIENDPEIDNLSDMMYAQLALICQHESHPIKNAIDRAKGLQAFRQQYGIVESYQDGSQALQELTELLPLHFLSWSFSEQDGVWVTVHDLARNDLSLINTPKKVNQYSTGNYYQEHAMSPDLETIRKGVITHAECEGFSFPKNGTIWIKLANELMAHYPLANRNKFYRTSKFFNVIMSILRKFLGKEHNDRVELGLTLGGSRLDTIFLVPNAKVATERTLRNMTDCLKRRFQNEERFSIPRTHIRREI